MIKFLPVQAIEEAAESFLRKYHPTNSLPIPIEEIIDLKLGLNIIPLPGLFDLHNIDAFLSSDRSGIVIDHDHLESRYSRARYSLAHEVGHWVLHADYLDSLQIDSLERWKQSLLGEGIGNAMMETQANMFASCLLMPFDPLKSAFEKMKAQLQADPFFNQAVFLTDDVTLASFVAGTISGIFNVSEEAAQYRLINWLNREKK